MNDPATRWNARLRLALAVHSVDAATADTVLDEVAQHCADSAEDPQDAFGTPEEYAAAVARERLPPEERLRRLHGDPTPREALRTAAAPVGLAALAAGAGLWAVNGPMLTLTPAGLAGAALIAVALAGGGLAATARSRRRRARGWTAVAAATLLGAAALTSLPAQPLGHLPAALLCLPGLGGVVKLVPAVRRPARTLAALSGSPGYIRYTGDPPPCERTHRTPHGPPSGRTKRLRRHPLALVCPAARPHRPKTPKE